MKKIREDTEFWVCISRHVKEKAAQHVQTIEEAGGHVLCDTCAIVTWTRDLQKETMLTNSAKTAFYAPTLNKTEGCISSFKTLRG